MRTTKIEREDLKIVIIHLKGGELSSQFQRFTIAKIEL